MLAYSDSIISCSRLSHMMFGLLFRGKKRSVAKRNYFASK